MRTLKRKKRGCGKRKKGGLYLVSEPGGGVLPLFVDIDPPIFYEGKLFRGTIQINLESVLAYCPMSEYLVGTSADRMRRKVLHEPEIEAFGMPLATRERIGICKWGGLEALGELRPMDIPSFGFGLRSLSGLRIGAVAKEIPRAFREAQNGDWAAVLACLWRIWNGCPKKTRAEARDWVRIAMCSIGAGDDALEVGK